MSGSEIVGEGEYSVDGWERKDYSDGTFALSYKVFTPERGVLEFLAEELYDDAGEGYLVAGDGGVYVLVGVNEHRDGNYSFFLSDNARETIQRQKEEFEDWFHGRRVSEDVAEEAS
jgi:hypothetical protein